MRKILQSLKKEQTDLITDLLKAAIVKERTTSTRKRRQAKTRAKRIIKQLVANEKEILYVC